MRRYWRVRFDSEPFGEGYLVFLDGKPLGFFHLDGTSAGDVKSYTTLAKDVMTLGNSTGSAGGGGVVTFVGGQH